MDSLLHMQVLVLAANVFGQVNRETCMFIWFCDLAAINRKTFGKETVKFIIEKAKISFIFFKSEITEHFSNFKYLFVL